MAHQAVRRQSTKLKIENHKIRFHYLETKNSTTFDAADFVQPGALRRYRNAKGAFRLSWKILVEKLGEECGFDKDKHVLAYSGTRHPKYAMKTYAAKAVSNEKSFNAAFREQIEWFKASEGGGYVVFWALRKRDLELREENLEDTEMEVTREAFLKEAGTDVSDEDGRPSQRLREVVGTWSEGVAEYPECEDQRVDDTG